MVRKLGKWKQKTRERKREGNGEVKQEIKIEGMYCPHCEERIEKALLALEGVAWVRADYASGTAVLAGNKKVSLSEAEKVLSGLGYSLKEKPFSAARSVSLVFVLLGLSALLDRLGLLNRLVPGELGENGMSYAAFFLTGLLTSVHCAAMCGGICLSQALPGKGCFAAAFYNTGRVLSYTLIGAVLGLAGGLIGGEGLSVSPLLQGAVKLAAGGCMLVAGVNLLGIFPALRRIRLRLPGLSLSGYAPFVVGLLNGLMPCGPLQAMELAALGSGSPLRGTLAMLCFSLGTVPLMLGLGGVTALLGLRFRRAVSTVGAVLVAVLGTAMALQGAALTGRIPAHQFWTVLLGLAVLGLISLLPSKKALRLGLSLATLALVCLAAWRMPFPLQRTESTSGDAEEEAEEVQLITSTLEAGRYPDIIVQSGVPVRWTILADERQINGCNAEMVIPALDLSLRFQPGENTLEFIPEEKGTIPYTCWMGMIRGSITVM